MIFLLSFFLWIVGVISLGFAVSLVPTDLGFVSLIASFSFIVSGTIVLAIGFATIRIERKVSELVKRFPPSLRNSSQLIAEANNTKSASSKTDEKQKSNIKEDNLSFLNDIDDKADKISYSSLDRDLNSKHNIFNSEEPTCGISENSAVVADTPYPNIKKEEKQIDTASPNLLTQEWRKKSKTESENKAPSFKTFNSHNVELSVNNSDSSMSWPNSSLRSKVKSNSDDFTKEATDFMPKIPTKTENYSHHDKNSRDKDDLYHEEKKQVADVHGLINSDVSVDTNQKVPSFLLRKDNNDYNSDHNMMHSEDQEKEILNTIVEESLKENKAKEDVNLDLDQANKTIVGSYTSSGILFTMYSDGSVSAKSQDDEKHFKSLDELREYLDRLTDLSSD